MVLTENGTRLECVPGSGALRASVCSSRRAQNDPKGEVTGAGIPEAKDVSQPALIKVRLKRKTPGVIRCKDV
jgi:hypothetical protein